jgi:transposase
LAPHPRGDKYVTVIIDLTPVRDARARRGCWTWSRAAPSEVFKTWLAVIADQAWRDAIEVVAMDGFTGFKTAAAQELPDRGPGP